MPVWGWVLIGLAAIVALVFLSPIIAIAALVVLITRIVAIAMRFTRGQDTSGLVQIASPSRFCAFAEPSTARTPGVGEGHVPAVGDAGRT